MSSESFNCDSDDGEEDFFLDDADYQGIETFGELDDLVPTTNAAPAGSASGGSAAAMTTSAAEDDSSELFDMVRARLRSTALGSRGVDMSQIGGGGVGPGASSRPGAMSISALNDASGGGGSSTGARGGGSSSNAASPNAGGKSVRMSMAASRSRGASMANAFSRKRLKSVITRVAAVTALAHSAKRDHENLDRDAPLVLKRIENRYDDKAELSNALPAPTVICVKQPSRIAEFVQAGLFEVMIRCLEKYPKVPDDRQIIDAASAALLLCISRHRPSEEHLQRLIDIEPYSRGVIEVLSEVVCYHPDMFGIDPTAKDLPPDDLSFDATTAPRPLVDGASSAELMSISVKGEVDDALASPRLRTIFLRTRAFIDQFPTANTSAVAGLHTNMSATTFSKLSPAPVSLNPVTNAIPSIVRFIDFTLRIENCAPVPVQRSMLSLMYKILDPPDERFFVIPNDKQSTIATMLERIVENCILGDDPVLIDFNRILVLMLVRFIGFVEDLDAMLSGCAIVNRILGQVSSSSSTDLTGTAAFANDGNSDDDSVAESQEAASPFKDTAKPAETPKLQKQLETQLATMLDKSLKAINASESKHVAAFNGVVLEWANQQEDVRETILRIVDAVVNAASRDEDGVVLSRLSWLRSSVAQGCRRAYLGIADAPDAAVASWAGALTALVLRGWKLRTVDDTSASEDVPLEDVFGLIIMARGAAKNGRFAVVLACASQLDTIANAVGGWDVLAPALAAGATAQQTDCSASAQLDAGDAPLLHHVAAIVRLATTSSTAASDQMTSAAAAFSQILTSLSAVAAVYGTTDAVLLSSNQRPSSAAAADDKHKDRESLLPSIVSLACSCDGLPVCQAQLLDAASNVSLHGLRAGSLAALDAVSRLLATVRPCDASVVTTAAARLAVTASPRAVRAAGLIEGFASALTMVPGTSAPPLLEALVLGGADASWVEGLRTASAHTRVLLYTMGNSLAPSALCRAAYITALCTSDVAAASMLRSNPIVTHLMDMEATAAEKNENPLSTEARAAVGRLRQLLLEASKVFDTDAPAANAKPEAEGANPQQTEEQLRSLRVQLDAAERERDGARKEAAEAKSEAKSANDAAERERQRREDTEASASKASDELQQQQVKQQQQDKSNADEAVKAKEEELASAKRTADDAIMRAHALEKEVSDLRAELREAEKRVDDEKRQHAQHEKHQAGHQRDADALKVRIASLENELEKAKAAAARSPDSDRQLEDELRKNAALLQENAELGRKVRRAERNATRRIRSTATTGGDSTPRGGTHSASPPPSGRSSKPSEVSQAVAKDHTIASLRRRAAVLEDRVTELQAELNESRRKVRILEEERQVVGGAADMNASTRRKQRFEVMAASSATRRYNDDNDAFEASTIHHRSGGGGGGSARAPSASLTREDFLAELETLRSRLDHADAVELDRMRANVVRATATFHKEKGLCDDELAEAQRVINTQRLQLENAQTEASELRTKAESYETLEAELDALRKRFDRTTAERKRDSAEIGQDPSATKTMQRLSLALARICDLEKEAKTSMDTQASLRLQNIETERKSKLALMLQHQSDLSIPWARTRIKRLEREIVQLKASLREAEKSSVGYRDRCEAELLVETEALRKRIAELQLQREAAVADAEEERGKVDQLHSEVSRRENIIAQFRHIPRPTQGSTTTVYVVEGGKKLVTSGGDSQPRAQSAMAGGRRDSAAVGGYDATRDPHLASYFTAGNASKAAKNSRSKASMKAGGR